MQPRHKADAKLMLLSAKQGGALEMTGRGR
jgi:hypothetical protein